MEERWLAFEIFISVFLFLCIFGLFGGDDLINYLVKKVKKWRKDN
ncbi:hypothetical protein [Shouchella lehensis]|nr:hypothetical protein [Shouchella lehensis]